MNWSISLSIFLMLLVRWGVIYPLDAIKLIEQISRQFRQSLIEKYGKKETKKLAQELIREARQQVIPVSVAREIIREHRTEIIQQLGNHYVEELLND